MKPPRGWSQSRVQDFANVCGGIPKGPHRAPGANPVRYLTVAHVQRNRVLMDDPRFFDVTPKELERWRLKPLDILIIEGNGSADQIGRTALFQGEIQNCVHQNHVIRVRVDASLASAHFLNAFLNSSVGQATVQGLSMTSSGLRTLSVGRIREIPITLPPLPEQRKIADILTTWDKALEKLDTLIAAKEGCKQGVMQQILTGRRRLKGFAGKWVTAKLGNLFEERVEPNRTDLPLLSITAGRGVVSRDELTKRDTSSEDKSKYLRIAPGDIGYNTMRMWQGVSALSALEGIVSPAYTICSPTPSIDGRFAAHFFKLPHTIHQFHRYSQGMVDDTLNLKYPNFAVIEVRVPGDVDEQRAIAAILDTCDEELRFLRAQRAALDRQKRGLMQRLLTGRIRVKLGEGIRRG
ncbi:MAG: restriction endonuclease subunit S [bacterium]